MSIANIGSKPTSIDNISLGYYKNNSKPRFWKKKIHWLNQAHPIEDFGIELANGEHLIISNLRIWNKSYNQPKEDLLQVGSSVIGAAYFEQQKAWGNLNPKALKDDKIRVKIMIKDIYGKTYTVKTTLKQISIEEAREFNPQFGNSEQIFLK